MSPGDLIEFGTFSDVVVDAAAAAVRHDADWHIAPRRTETMTLIMRRGTGSEIPLKTRDFPEAPVVVTAVVGADGVPLTGWDSAEGLLLLPRRLMPGRRLTLTLTHGFTVCPPDLLPILAQRASAAKSPRDSRVSSFTNGAVQMSFAGAYQMDPAIARYAVIGGVGS